MHRLTAAAVDIPAIGLGTAFLSGAAGVRQVAAALQAGYRHLDTAAEYGNEREVGEGLRVSGVPRDEVMVTTKVWRDDLAEDVLPRAAEASLRRLGLERIDLLLIHWPNAAIPLAGTMRALAGVKRRGLARAIGVSNFNLDLLDEAVALCPEPLAANQIEYHPYLSQRRQLEALRRHGMGLIAYSPLAEGRVVRDPVIQAIAAARGVTPAQVALAWLIAQPGVAAVPKTADPERARRNLEAGDLTLAAEEIAAISALARPDGRLTRLGWARWDPAD